MLTTTGRKSEGELTLPMIAISHAERKDARAILGLQKLAYQSEARLYNDWSLPPLTQSLESLLDEFGNSIILKAMVADQIVGSVRAKASMGTCAIGRLIVHPGSQRKGIGSKMLAEIESRLPEVSRFELFTGSKSEANIRLYQRHGYKITHTKPLSATMSITFMEKLAAAISQ